MITQYSRVQLTLSEKEKEYAWFSYAAKIIRAGCNDQQMSGYTVTGTGIDGQEIKAELTNEELFQLFSEITMKYGRKLVTQEMEQHSLDQESDELLKPDITDRPLERRDYQIQITRHELKSRCNDHVGKQSESRRIICSKQGTRRCPFKCASLFCSGWRTNGFDYSGTAAAGSCIASLPANGT